MLLKTGIVVIRTAFFKNHRTGKVSKSKYIWQELASNVISLPRCKDIIFVPNEDGEGVDLEVTSVEHDLGRNQTTVNVTADIGDMYSDLQDK